MNIQIRQARLEEADLLTELSMRSKQSNGYDDAFMAACRDELTVTKESLLKGEYWVAVAETVCGVVGLSCDETGNSGEVSAFFIDPEWKRKGIGRLLWQKLVERAVQKGIKYLRLDAEPSAVPFYKALGLETVREVPSGSLAGRTLPQMTITLD